MDHMKGRESKFGEWVEAILWLTQTWTSFDL